MYKKLVIASAALLGFSTLAIASENNAFYVGTQFGLARMHYSGSDYTLPSNSVDNNQLGGHFYAGYSFTELLAAELGYGYYGNIEFKHNPDGNKQDLTQQGIDLVGKVSIPLDYGFGFYVKGGGIWLHRDSLESRGGYFANKDSNGRVAALGGLGITYNFTPQWASEVFWTGSTSNGDLPKMFFYGIGLTYKFTAASAADAAAAT